MPTRLLCPLLFALALLAGSVQAQYSNPPYLQPGLSIGAGGGHMFFKPAFQLRYHTTTLHLAPGLHFLSVGLTQRLHQIHSQRKCGPIDIIASIHWHDDWLLMPIQRARRGNDHIRDLDGWNLLAGVHLDLNPQGTVYMQASGGFLYLVEKYNATAEATLPPPNGQFIYPMLELRLGVWIRKPARKELFNRHMRQKPNEIFSPHR